MPSGEKKFFAQGEIEGREKRAVVEEGKGGFFQGFGKNRG